jgi:formate dehydrogenase maturation protein FdhE
MAFSSWQRRIHRAQDLISWHGFAAEILGFYIHLARFQEELNRALSAALPSPAACFDRELAASELSELSSRFEAFLSVVQAHGPERMSTLSREMAARGQSFWNDLLREVWTAPSPSDAQGLLARAFLQPYAELQRSRCSARRALSALAVCPFCCRKPAVGVLRQMGDGAARSLICSFCLAEWEFRRIVCAGCGEENDRHLSVFTASDFEHIRVECCDSCKTYIKSIDLTKNGHAEPIVDELASAPLDLWACERNYAKLQSNILGM